MRNMITSSNNKNSLINCERKHQKPQISIGSKFSLKCMKNAWKMRLNQKRKGKIVLPVLDDKNLWERLREIDKKFVFESGSVEERERE